MASFIKIRPILTEDLLLGPSHRRGSRNVIPHESTLSLSQHQVTETEKEIRISLDVPGVKASDISVTTDDKSIHINGTRRLFGNCGETKKKSSFSKSFPVDNHVVDLSQMKANLADGVLVVSAPKKPKPEPRSILITTEPHESDSNEKRGKHEDDKPALQDNESEKKGSAENEHKSGKDCQGK